MIKLNIKPFELGGVAEVHTKYTSYHRPMKLNWAGNKPDLASVENFLIFNQIDIIDVSMVRVVPLQMPKAEHVKAKVHSDGKICAVVSLESFEFTKINGIFQEIKNSWQSWQTVKIHKPPFESIEVIDHVPTTAKNS